MLHHSKHRLFFAIMQEIMEKTCELNQLPARQGKSYKSSASFFPFSEW